MLDRLLAARGRRRSELVISAAPYLKGIDRAKLERYAAAGADQVIVNAFAPDLERLTQTLGELADSLL